MTLPPAAQALLSEASGLFRAGRMADAREAYRRLLADHPALPNSWFNLAVAERRLRDPAAALAAYDRALAEGIDGPEEVHLQRAVILSEDMGDPAGARLALERALALAPDYLPALLNLGNLHEDLGERDAARTVYARAVATAPASALALARLAGVSDLASPGDPLLRRLEVVAGEAQVPLDRADAGFALGAALDRLGEYDAAFDAFVAANRAMAALLPRYDPAAQEALVERLIAAFPARADGPGDGGWAPIFVCGMFRSGSTLVESMLGRHPGVSAGGELDSLPALAANLSPEATAVTDVAPMRAQYRAEAAPRKREGTSLTDKRPDNIWHLGLAKRMFPDARIVRTQRDPRDTALSVFFLQGGAGLAYATDLRMIAHYHQQEGRLAAHWRGLWPDEFVDVDYDALVAEPQPAMERLLRFLGLDWTDAVLSPERGDGVVRTASVWQVRRPIYTGSSGKWRNYRRQLTAHGIL